MRKVMKLALEEEQIRIKSHYDLFDGYEIHLYGNQKDHFELADQLTKPIVTVHYPIDRCDIYDVCNEYQSDYARKVFDLCKKAKAGLVVHAETGLQRLISNPNLDGFCNFIAKEGIVLHVENCTGWSVPLKVWMSPIICAPGSVKNRSILCWIPAI